MMKMSGKRLSSLLLAMVMVITMLPVHAFAQDGSPACANHPTHTDCGYVPAQDGTACDHVCGESCIATNCVHNHEDLGCTWVEAVEAAPCEHEEDCDCPEAVPAHWDCAHTCSAESGCVRQFCTHDCTDVTCGYTPAVDGSPCTHSCEQCAPKETEAPAAKLIESWTWVDPEEYLTKGELSIPGVNAEQPASLDLVLSFLPTAIVAEAYGEIPVTFSCDTYPAEGAYSGSYTFTAALPEGYELAEGAKPLTVPVTLGEAEVLADGTTWDGTTVATAFAGGTGTASDPYQIATCGQLAYLAKLLKSDHGTDYNNYYNKTYILTADLDMNKKPFTGIKYFNGTFKGNGNHITNLSISGDDSIGLFCTVESNALIENLVVKGSVSHTDYAYCAGGIAGRGSGTITNCINVCSVTGGQAVGGIAGSWSGTITHCSNEAAINGVLSTGGIVGIFSYGEKTGVKLQNCKNSGSVTGKTQTGGIVGSQGDVHSSQVSSVCITISQCANLGTVKGTKRVGGIVGYSTGGGIEQCANVSTVIGEGAADVSTYSGNYVGGIVGYMLLRASDAGVSEYSAGYLRDCYNAGTIIADYCIGGIAGQAMGSSVRNLDIKRVYNVGKLYSNKGDTFSGYEPGRLDSASSGYLYYMEDNNPSMKVVENATALTQTQMCSLSNFSGFSSTVWQNGSGSYTYPVIRALGVLTVAGCPHRYTNYVSNNDATCEANGTKTALCALGCGSKHTITESGTKLPHTYGPWEKLDDTSHKHTCGSCGHSETAAHEWDAGTVTTQPTTQTEGIRTYTCTVCSHTKTEPVEKLPDTSPKAAIDFEKELLTGLIPGKTYTVNGETLTAGADGTLVLHSGWLGKEIVIIQKAENESETDSDPQTLTVPARPAAPAGLQAVAESEAGKNDGKLTGVTSGMEYRKAGAADWTAITGTSVENLAPGSYEVRYKAEDGAFSGTVLEVVIAAGEEPVVVPTSVTLNLENLRIPKKGTATLTATVYPEDAADKTVTWTSDKTSVVTVDKNGKLTAVTQGTAKITATTSNGKTAVCTVVVYKGYNVIVDGIEAAHDNHTDILGDGTVSYAPATGILTLNGATITASDFAAIEGKAGLKIELAEGSYNVLDCSSTKYGIYAAGGVTISGKGTLIVKGNWHSILSSTLNITDATVCTTGPLEVTRLTLNNAVLKSDGQLSAIYSGNVVISGSSHLVVTDDSEAISAYALVCEETPCYWRADASTDFTADTAVDYSKPYVEVITGSHLAFTDDKNGTTHSFGCADKNCVNAVKKESGAHIWNYTAEGALLTAHCAGCTASGTAALTAPDNCSYTGKSREVSLQKSGTLAGKDLSVTYGPADALTDGLPVNAGTYTASVSMTGADGKTATATLEFTVEKAIFRAEDFTFASPAEPVYDASPKEPVIGLPAGLTEADVTVVITDAQSNEVVSPVNAGNYKVLLSIKGDENHEPVNGLTSDSWTFTIQPREITPTVSPIPRQLYTGNPIEPEVTVSFSGASLQKDVDYTLTYENNINAGTASVRIEGIPGGNYTIVAEPAAFTISYGVRLPGQESATVYVDGAAADREGDLIWLDSLDSRVITTHTYHNADASDVHTQYPTDMKVWLLEQEKGIFTATPIPELDNLLQYSGCSIRIVGVKGIRMITSINQSTKKALTGKGLAGFTLVEYGTALCRASALADGQPMTLENKNVKSNYAYKKGVADPVFKYSGNLVQYTNVLVGFTDDDCKEDIAMRPYIILQSADGETVTVYGGIIYRSIGYIAYQNRNAFAVGSDAYEYVWSIIHHVYGDEFNADYKS